eukprot:CAMPEP_0116843124 /NCGR_PEP_ID=MMETSP0418-20121206/11909_1 /TAXON_ID=1158023 /ORGANISM="Astrosyne radiata, Strain 13vi08-1A" /LENGTH=385 /DNA_ID=CAMNT_0004473833 /DNA_START=91 /DNA_END=1248 /DNA_ORIENTATION=-
MMMTTMMMTATMVNGYAMLCTPKTRVQVAMETGVVSSDANAATLPPDEDCPYCQEGSVCGKSTMVDYNAWQYAADGSGKIEFQEQAVYVMGNEIVLESILFPNHRGFIQAAVCPNTKTPTKACFQQYPLVFVEDELYGAPRDIVYPQRAYIPPSGIAGAQYSDCGGLVPTTGMLMRHRFRLPEVMYGEVLLQFQYVSNVGCRMPVSTVYPWPSGWEPFGKDENICFGSSNAPRTYTQCAEISIYDAPSSTPSVSLSPSTTPPTLPESYFMDETTGEFCRWCCSLDGGKTCPTFDDVCFTETNCGKPPSCDHYGNQVWTKECQKVGCCARKGVCDWNNAVVPEACNDYTQCGKDNSSGAEGGGVDCSWGGDLSWIGPIPNDGAVSS